MRLRELRGEVGGALRELDRQVIADGKGE